MKLFPISALVAVILFSGTQVSAQTGRRTPNADRSDRISTNIRTLDVMIQIIPLALTKEQLIAILPSMEKAREKEFEIRKLEDEDLAKYEARLEKAVKDGVEKGAYPPRDLSLELAKLTRAIGIRRQVALGEMIDLVYESTQKNLNAGQKKVMENSLKPELLDPKLKSDQMTTEQKIRFYIKSVMMDATCYDLLLKLLKAAG